MKRKPQATEEQAEIVSQAAFARRLDVSRQYVSKLVAEGMPVTADRRVIVADALAWLQGRVGLPKGAGEGDAADLVKARVRLIQVQTAVKITELRQIKGELIRRDDAVHVVRSISRMMRDAILNFPNRSAGEIAAEVGCSSRALAASLESHLRDLLTELANTPIPLPLDIDDVDAEDKIIEGADA